MGGGSKMLAAGAAGEQRLRNLVCTCAALEAYAQAAESRGNLRRKIPAFFLPSPPAALSAKFAQFLTKPANDVSCIGSGFASPSVTASNNQPGGDTK